jgi:hypothetical protein
MYYFPPEYVTKRTRQSTKSQFLFSNQGYNRYLRVYPWALRLYHPSASMYSLRLRLRLCSSVPGWKRTKTSVVIIGLEYVLFPARFILFPFITICFTRVSDKDIISDPRVYPLTLRLYHPGTLQYSLRRSRRLYIDAEGWYNLNGQG